MFELIVAACFSAFFLAVIDQLVDLKLFKAQASLIFSSVGLYLLGVHKPALFAALTVAAAFLSLFITVAADRMTTFKPAVIRPIRPEQ
jgi:membrane-bound metal-dependent hydrolase YbcI (DUF457 family)